jgi:iron(III) transport system ATP-binding protein
MLEVEHATLGYGDTAVVHDVSLHLRRGEIGCLLGASGCGKTTLLRAIGGFEPLRAGQIVLGGRTVATPAQQLPPRARGIGMVFQDHALFPHLDVAGNVAFGLRDRPKAERAARVEELLALVGLAHMQQRWPHELSGGQQQRVALARALAPRPDLLLLDEPFSNLDASLRESIAREVRAILRQAGATALMVTHDQQEAFALGDRIGVMAAGRLCQWDSAYNVYRQPAERAVAELVGEGAFVEARVVPGGGWDTVLGHWPASQPAFATGPGMQLLVRPEELRLDGNAALRGTVHECVFRGASFLYTVLLSEGTRVLVQGDASQPLAAGAAVGLRPAAAAERDAAAAVAPPGSPPQ